ncbi:MAG: hypothetical protein D6744_07855 [Planctomycetota bacterium]|nr:MAG: hypothetical protein D6744_07855 [Planctomycetota bacterium]
MTQRSRILAGLIVVLLAVAAGRQIVTYYILQPQAELKDRIARARAEYEELTRTLPSKRTIQKLWRRHTMRTLESDEAAAALTFRRDIEMLLQRNGLKVAGTTIANKAAKRVTSEGPRQGFVELPVSVNTKGRLSNVERFLRDFYQRPYIKRVDSLSLSPEPSGSRAGKTPPPDPELTIAMTLTTLILPPIEGFETVTLDAEKLNDPKTLEEVDLEPYLAQSSVVAYNAIASTNMFKVYVPPPPPPPRPAREEPKVAQADQTPASPTPPPPPPDRMRFAEFLTLIGVESRDGVPIAYVHNSKKEFDPPREYHLNDEVPGGRIVLIHPRGMVVREVETVGTRKTTKLWFYPLGKRFDERVLFDPYKYPDLQEQLQLVLRR